MQQTQNITTAQPYLTILPENDQVFAASDMFLAKHMLPLVSIDLSVINPEWQGLIHLVNPVEPADCYIGDYTPEYHNDFAGQNWFILQLDENNHYQWLGQRQYFILENDNHHELCFGQMQPHSEAMHKDYLKVKARFKETGEMISTSCLKFDLEFRQTHPNILLNWIGGEFSVSNYISPLDQYFDLKIIDRRTDDEEVHIYDKQGRRYYFIACASGWQYCTSGADDILMYYQPETKRVLYTFDWT